MFSIFHADNTSDSVFSIFFTSHSVFSIFYTPCFPYFILRVFHILYSVFSIFYTPCFPYFILRVFHFLTSHSGAPTPRLRLRNSDSGTPAPCFPFNLAEEPSIHFVSSISSGKWSFIPTANTCGNTLYLPYPDGDTALPAENELFEVYDMAFSNAYFGNA